LIGAIRGRSLPVDSHGPPRVICFARLKDPALFQLVEFYREDLLLFERLGFEVVTETRLLRAAMSNADVLFAFWGGPALPVVAVWRLRGKRRSIVSGAVAFSDRGDRSARTVLKWLGILGATRLADDALAVSELELADLHRLGVKRARLAYHCIDTDFYNPAPKAPRPIGVTIGQLSPGNIERKGIEVAIAATELIRRQRPEYELNVIGPMVGGGREWIDTARERYDFAGINILGEVDREQKRSLLRSAWVYLQPSRYEAFGVAAAEALSCGTVVVHTVGGALSEIVADGGVLVESRTSAAVADAVIRLIEDPGRREAIQDRARNRALSFSRASREKVVRDLSSLRGLNDLGRGSS